MSSKLRNSVKVGMRNAKLHRSCLKNTEEEGSGRHVRFPSTFFFFVMDPLLHDLRLTESDVAGASLGFPHNGLARKPNDLCVPELKR